TLGPRLPQRVAPAAGGDGVGAGGGRERRAVASADAAARLREAGWGGPNRDPALGPLLATVDDGGPDPVTGLAQRGVGQANKQQRRQAVLDVALDRDRMAFHADQGDGVGARDRHLAHSPHLLNLPLTRLV